jgi:hypothetical protein
MEDGGDELDPSLVGTMVRWSNVVRGLGRLISAAQAVTAEESRSISA